MLIKKIHFLQVSLLYISFIALSSCSNSGGPEGVTITVVDQLGRKVTVPKKVRKVAALHHFGGKVVFALGQQDKLVDQALYHRETQAMARVNPSFAKKPKLIEGHGINNEGLVALKPDVAICYVSFDPSQMEQLENAGIRVIAIKAETVEESYAGVRLVAKVLGCEKRGEVYIADCERLFRMVRERTAGTPPEKRLKVMFAGPKNIYTVATGQMMQHELLATAGGRNVAAALTGFWASVSPEQIVAWDPDVIFLGSTLDTYGADALFNNQQFLSVKAVKNRRVHVFPSNIGWWDYPAPHCVLGAVWAAKTLYPDRFRDVDMTRTADEFYRKYLGFTFTEMGGKL